jgi:prefoldin subunit 5
MKHADFGCRLVLVAVLTAMTGPALSSYQRPKDPDWPCIQRKVPELSLGQIWNGPELPAAAADWQKDPDIPELVTELAARRVPIAEAQQEIRDFAATLPKEKPDERLMKLVQGLFDHMNQERSQVISGIGRYARNQVELASRLRKEASELDALRAKADANAAEVTDRTNRLTWETRIFEERVQSLTYVCEVPTLIEQRLYALAKTVAEIIAGK